MVSFPTIFCIGLLNFLLLFASEIYCGSIQARPSNHTNATVSCSYFDRDSFVISISNLSLVCSTRFLTNNVMLSAGQQNTHAILRLLFGKHQLINHFRESPQESHNERLKDQDKFNTDQIDFFNKTLIGYDRKQEWLFVTRSVWNEQRSIRSLKHFPVKIQLPSVGVLYNKIIAKGIDLAFMLHMFPRIINLYEAEFKMQAPDSPVLTNFLNSLIKEFIWKRFRPKDEKMKTHPSSIMQRLAKEFFWGDLNAQIRTVKQGYMGHLYAHITSKPCTVYEKNFFIGMGYLKDSIELIEKCKLPTCPSSTKVSLNDNICYCIRTYNPSECKKIKTADSKHCEQEETTSPLKTAIPLMRVPEGTVLITCLTFSKKSLFNLLGRKQKIDAKKRKDIDKDQSNGGIQSFSFSTMISDEQLHIFMDRFAAYLYTNANKYLHEANDE